MVLAALAALPLPPGVEALRFYADEAQYVSNAGTPGAVTDGGQRARHALAAATVARARAVDVVSTSLTCREAGDLMSGTAKPIAVAAEEIVAAI